MDLLDLFTEFITTLNQLDWKSQLPYIFCEPAANIMFVYSYSLFIFLKMNGWFWHILEKSNKKVYVHVIVFMKAESFSTLYIMNFNF